MTNHPTNVAGGPKYSFGLGSIDGVHALMQGHRIIAGVSLNSFGFPGCSARVKYVQRVVSGQSPDGFSLRLFDTGFCFEIAPFLIVNLESQLRAFEYPNGFGRKQTLSNGLINHRFVGDFFFTSTPTLAVINSFGRQLLMRVLSSSSLKPPKTTECMAPILVQASMQARASGISSM
jgi:hypothetical protein